MSQGKQPQQSATNKTGRNRKRFRPVLLFVLLRKKLLSFNYSLETEDAFEETTDLGKDTNMGSLRI